MAPFVAITSHTTASKPRPHILYAIKVNIDGRALTVQKRYSEVYLHFLPVQDVIANKMFSLLLFMVCVNPFLSDNGLNRFCRCIERPLQSPSQATLFHDFYPLGMG